MEPKKFIVETSAHHIHVTKETLDYLFDGQPFNVLKMLSQPGQFASDKKLDVIYHASYFDEETKSLVKEDKIIKGMRILGPCRKENQIEISMTEARALKAKVPVRESGDLEGSCPVTLVNPKNGKRVECQKGLIVAKRHIHMTSKDAEAFQVKNGDIVAVKIISTNGRNAILGDTVIRVSDSYALAMHIDTDESNAVGGASEGVLGYIVKVER